MGDFEVAQWLCWRCRVRCLDVWNSQEFCCYITFLGKVAFPTSVCGAVWEFTLTWPLHRAPTSDYYAAHSLTPFWLLVRSSRNSQSGSDLQNMCVTKGNSQNSVLGINLPFLNSPLLSWTCLSSYDLPILEVRSKPSSFHVILSRPRSFCSPNVMSLTFEKWLFSLNRLTGFSEETHSVSGESSPPQNVFHVWERRIIFRYREPEVTSTPVQAVMVQSREPLSI